jgi:branched-chain amino acid transport system ATP-binding protein
VTDQPLLEASGVVCTFGGLRAVDGADIEVAQGEITALIGPNGAGKTTFFNVLTGFTRPRGGSVRFDGEEIAAWPSHRIARRGMVRTFQLTKALSAMPVLDNMLLAAPDQPGEHLINLIARPRRARTREREIRVEALSLLERFRLADHADAYAGTLSGGQRKLLELARALMARPRLLLLDEPLAGVNPTLGLQLLEHMQRLRRESGVTFLFIEHDMPAVMNHADRVVVMAEGRTILSGTPQLVANDERVLNAYLGGQQVTEVGA